MPGKRTENRKGDLTQNAGVSRDPRRAASSTLTADRSVRHAHDAIGDYHVALRHEIGRNNCPAESGMGWRAQNLYFSLASTALFRSDPPHPQ